VKRASVLEAGKPKEPGPELDAWNAKITTFLTYHEQLVNALKFENFSTPQGLGRAWAVVPTFKDLNDNSYYEGQHSFDGWFEQVHDNFHGWIGGSTGDMVSVFPFSSLHDLTITPLYRPIIHILHSIRSFLAIIATWIDFWKSTCDRILKPYSPPIFP
jgi:hypothetical protein